MSKASKKVAKKARKTIIASLKAEANNWRCLADEYGAKNVAAQEEIKKITRQADENAQRATRASENSQANRASIERLKVTIAGLERDLAEARGIISVYEKQADQAAEPVMVKPPVMMTPREARMFSAAPFALGGSAVGDLATLTRAGESIRPNKHWTAE